MNLHSVKIVSDRPGSGKIFFDGQEIKGVTSVDLHMGVEEVSEIKLNIFVKEIDVEIKNDELAIQIDGTNIRELIEQARGNRYEQKQ